MGSGLINPPVVKKPVAFILFIVNIFAPGVGTILAGFLVCDLKTVIIGVLQMVTAAILIGWVWSIMWGCELLQIAREKRLTVPGIGTV